MLKKARISIVKKNLDNSKDIGSNDPGRKSIVGSGRGSIIGSGRNSMFSSGLT